MNPRKIILNVALSVLVAGIGCIIIPGCNSDPQTSNLNPAPVHLVQSTGEEHPRAAAGARLWAQNCIRCHNIRTPASLSDRQWKIVMHHMQVRANLTATEHEAILRFLQAAN